MALPLQLDTRDLAPPPIARVLMGHEFRSLARSLTVARGDTVRQRQTTDNLLLIVDGATKLVAHVPGGREQIVSFQFAEDLLYMPERSANDYALIALTDGELLSWPADELLDAIRSEPEFLGALVRQLFVTLERSREKSVLMGRKTAQERAASFIVSMTQRIGIPRDNRCELVLPMSRRDIADSLGLTIETVSRQFTELRELGVIETTGRSTVIVLDLEHLRRKAGL